MILLDREIDVVTPMCTQLTYEGLTDETLQIKNGSVMMDGTSGRHRMNLTSAGGTVLGLRSQQLRCPIIAPL